MDTRILAFIVIGVVVLIVIAALLVMRKRKSAQLKEHFGPNMTVWRT
jgi:LPXTG-motif cell wall-anchored protein